MARRGSRVLRIYGQAGLRRGTRDNRMIFGRVGRTVVLLMPRRAPFCIESSFPSEFCTAYSPSERHFPAIRSGSWLEESAFCTNLASAEFAGLHSKAALLSILRG